MRHEIATRSILKYMTIATLLSGCSTLTEKQIREKKKYTVGYPGVQYRPTGSISLMTSYLYTTGIDSYRRENANAETEELWATSKANHDRSSVFNFSSYYYPFDDLGFCFGVGAQKTYEDISFNDENGRVYGTTTNDFLGVPLGWTWIWESGLTLHVDYGSFWSIKHQSTYSTDETETDYNLIRDSLIGFNGDRKSPSRQGIGLIGWSF